MRKIALFLFLTVTLISYGQDTPHWLVGGDLKLSGQETAGIPQYTFRIQASAARFVYKGFAAGISGLTSIKGGEKEIGGGPILRYYYFIGQGAPYVGINGGYRERYIEIGSGQSTYKIWYAGAKLGYISKLNNHVALDFFGFYDAVNTQTFSSTGSISNPLFGAEFGLGVGFQIFL